jgi:AcrR family transcriptional regulator
MLSSAVQVVSEGGYGRMSVARITSRAGVSRRTFYDLFDNREDCFLAVFDEAITEMSELASTAFARESTWREGVRAALAALLGFCDERPELGLLVVVEALGGGPRVLERRAKVIAILSDAIDAGRAVAGQRREAPPLTAEGIVGAILGLLHARLREDGPAQLVGLLNPLMAMVVAPYLGHSAAARELDRPSPPRVTRAPKAIDPLAGLNMRITYRTFLVLSSISEWPGASNRQVAAAAEVADQGQISRLLARLEGLGLIANSGGAQPNGEPNAWKLTPRGQDVQRAIAARSTHGENHHTTEIGEGL